MIRQVKHMGQADSTSIGPTSGADVRQGAAGEFDKSQTWDLARTLGGDALVDIVLEQSHTCYHGVREERHAWGYGCGTCPACALRKAGFERWNATQAR